MTFKQRLYTSALALSAAVVLGGFAMAQDQLRASVTSQLQEHQISGVDVNALTGAQLSQVQLVLNSSESESSKAAIIESLIVQRDACEGSAQLRAQVEGQLKEHNITIENFENVGGPDIVLLEAILNSTATDANKTAMIQGMFADDVRMAGNAQLKADVEQCILRYDADVDNLDALTPDQLVQIELIAGGSESADAKRAMIESIADK